MLHYLIDDTPEEVVVPANSMYIQDGNALFHALKNLPPTFGEICLKVLDQMVAKTNFVFSTDSYHPDSIKSQERLRRGFSQRYIVDGQATRKPVDFKLFLANEDNKLQLCELLLTSVGKQGSGLSTGEMWICRGSCGRQGIPAGNYRRRCEYIVKKVCKLFLPNAYCNIF